MLYTTGQIRDGITASDYNIDLSGYAKKEDTATKIDLNNLATVVSGKIDKTPQHTHDIQDIKQLQLSLNGKLSNDRTYSYKTLINDIETVDKLNDVKINCLRFNDIYNMKADTNGDLYILKGDVPILTYNGSNWITNDGINLNSFITNTNDTLQNHKQAIEIISNGGSVGDVAADVQIIANALNKVMTKIINLHK